MAIKPKLTTAAACRVVGIDRNRFNEHVAGGRYICAPGTIPGRARVFNADDMLALWMFHELMEDGMDAQRAGRLACQILSVAKENPDAPALAWVQDFFKGPNGYSDGFVITADKVPPADEWDRRGFGGTNIRKVTTFNIAYTRKIIAHRTAEEMSISGEDD